MTSIGVYAEMSLVCLPFLRGLELCGQHHPVAVVVAAQPPVDFEVFPGRQP